MAMPQSEVTINETTYPIGPDDLLVIIGASIRINGVIVGKLNNANADQTITLSGDPLNVDSNRSVHVKGDVKGSVDAAGSVRVDGSVGGSIDATGSVTCGDVGGNIDTTGSVTCGDVKGDIDTVGSVTVRKG